LAAALAAEDGDNHLKREQGRLDLVTQRHLETALLVVPIADTEQFGLALRAALGQYSDVILLTKIGEGPGDFHVGTIIMLILNGIAQLGVFGGPRGYRPSHQEGAFNLPALEGLEELIGKGGSLLADGNSRGGKIGAIAQ